MYYGPVRRPARAEPVYIRSLIYVHQTCQSWLLPEDLLKPHRPAPVRLVPEPARTNTRHARHCKSPPVVSSHSPKGPWLHWSVWSSAAPDAHKTACSLPYACRWRPCTSRVDGRYSESHHVTPGATHFYMRSCSYCHSRPSAYSPHPLPWSRGVRRSRCCHPCRRRRRRLREVERALALIDRGEEALLHDYLARVVRQLDIVGASHHRGQVGVG